MTLGSRKDRVHSVRYFTYDMLVECLARRDEWGLDRQVDDDIATLPTDRLYHVVDVMEHEHAFGEEVDLHMRCFVLIDDEGEEFAVDVPMDFFDTIPTFPILVAK